MQILLVAELCVPALSPAAFVGWARRSLRRGEVLLFSAARAFAISRVGDSWGAPK